MIEGSVPTRYVFAYIIATFPGALRPASLSPASAASLPPTRPSPRSPSPGPSCPFLIHSLIPALLSPSFRFLSLFYLFFFLSILFPLPFFSFSILLSSTFFSVSSPSLIAVFSCFSPFYSSISFLFPSSLRLSNHSSFSPGKVPSQLLRLEPCAFPSSLAPFSTVLLEPSRPLSPFYQPPPFSFRIPGVLLLPPSLARPCTLRGAEDVAEGSRDSG